MDSSRKTEKNGHKCISSKKRVNISLMVKTSNQSIARFSEIAEKLLFFLYNAGIYGPQILGGLRLRVCPIMT